MPPVSLDAGSIAILPRNDPHLLASRTGLPPANVERGRLDHRRGRPPRVDRDRRRQGRGVVRLPGNGQGERASVARRAAAAADARCRRRRSAVARQLDALPRRAEPVAGNGRAAGRAVPRAGDPRICRAAAGRTRRAGCAASPIRRCPRRWRSSTDATPRSSTIEELAREAGVSRSVLGERFVELLGEPPMRYCARWRMRMAANMLRDGKDNTANIAYAVGFNSEAAFNRAFKREYGEPPATWRRRVEAEEQARARIAERPRTAAAAGALLHGEGRHAPGLFGDRRGPAAGQDGQLAQPYRA